mmetsp:Transcript_7858/g.19988  ORF Transcript_7858/g.19988 Transcript_7858/m.19988 type:complete len:164 (-) Transcript_7858:188-679(-)
MSGVLSCSNSWQNRASRSEVRHTQPQRMSLPPGCVDRGGPSDPPEPGHTAGKYAWAIPDQRAIRIIANFSPLVEIGAGKGYWAMLLRQAGADVLALDITGSSRKKGAAPGKKGLQGQWSEVRKVRPAVPYVIHGRQLGFHRAIHGWHLGSWTTVPKVSCTYSL